MQIDLFLPEIGVIIGMRLRSAHSADQILETYKAKYLKELKCVFRSTTFFTLDELHRPGNAVMLKHPGKKPRRRPAANMGAAACADLCFKCSNTALRRLPVFDSRCDLCTIEQPI